MWTSNQGRCSHKSAVASNINYVGCEEDKHHLDTYLRPLETVRRGESAVPRGDDDSEDKVLSNDPVKELM